MGSLNLSSIELPPLPKDMELPPLPTIDDDLAQVVFTHSSLLAKPHRPTALDGDITMDWEKLEFIGDGLLGFFINSLLHSLFPSQPEGTATILKAQLVRNSLLAQISQLYKLPDRIRSPAASVVSQSTKAQASVFEAYVAGVYYGSLDNYLKPPEYLDPSKALRWLTAVFKPIAKLAEQSLRDQLAAGSDSSDTEPEEADAGGGVASLYTWVSVRNGKRYRTRYPNGAPTVTFKDAPVGDLQVNLCWEVTCTFFDGEETHVASAVRPTKSSAKNMAALKASKLSSAYSREGV